MKKQYLNFKSGKNNKGFIFSFDISMAVFVAFILLAVSVYYVGLANEEPLSRLQLARTGNDIATILDYKGTLNDLDKTEIQNEMRTLLPLGYEMRMIINGTFPQESIVAESTVDPPSRKFMIGNKRTFVVYNEDETYFVTADYTMWLE